MTWRAELISTPTSLSEVRSDRCDKGHSIACKNSSGRHPSHLLVRSISMPSEVKFSEMTFSGNVSLSQTPIKGKRSRKKYSVAPMLFFFIDPVRTDITLMVLVLEDKKSQNCRFGSRQVFSRIAFKLRYRNNFAPLRSSYRDESKLMHVDLTRSRSKFELRSNS